MERPLTLWDRIVYGAISAGFGALLRLGAAACIFFAFQGNVPFRWIVLFSAIYFFGVGVMRGPDAAYLTGEAIAGVAGVAMAEFGAIPGESSRSNNPWSSWSSPVALAIWVVIVGVLAWRA